MSDKEILIKCIGAELADIDELEEFQGELKSLSTEGFGQLRKNIIETGVGFPFRVWKNDGKKFIIGGHQTKRVLKELRNEGYKIPMVPISLTEANSYQEAKIRVLQDVAQYGKIERQGLYEFMVDANIDPGSLAMNFTLPDLDLPSFNAEFFHDLVTGSPGGPSPEKTGAKEYEAAEFGKFNHICPRCGFQFD